VAQFAIVRIVAIVATAAVVALTGAASAATPEGRLLAIANGNTLVWVDAASLTPLPGPSATLPRNAGGGWLSPSGSTYVVGSNSGPVLTFFDVQRMQIGMTMSTARIGSSYPIAWPEDRVCTWTCGAVAPLATG
jgi:hypothetical protein